MKPALQLRLSQHLTLTPQLQQSIRLLQLSTLELEQELERFLLENPLLERVEDEYARADGPGARADSPDLPDAPNAPETEEADDTSSAADESWLDERPDEAGAYATAAGSFDDEDGENRGDVQAATISLREHLTWQLGLINVPARDRVLVQCLIETLDEDGYLTQTPEELAEILPSELAIEPEELQIALRRLQNFDPTGVGARDARECLLLQLYALPADESQKLAVGIVRHHLELLASRDFAKLMKYTGCDEEALRAAQLLIRRLNPRPGASYAPLETRYVTPDVLVRKQRGQWVAHVNSDAYPRLRINSLYAQLLAGQRGSGLAGQLQEARWLIKNVQQRFETILKVTQCIIDRQRQFLDHGEVAMRPLVLREVADALGLHESTVSRVTTQKYMDTPRGIFELKYFFGSHVATDAGGACSATAIRALIKQLVGAENPKKPLSDNRIAELLGQQGIVVARRTIAKYREGLNIPPVKRRKTI